MSYKKYDFTGFVGVFQEELIRFVKLKQSLGFKYTTSADILKRFSKFSLNYVIINNNLSKDLVDAWIIKRNNECDVTCEKRINTLKQFSLYLISIGYEAYIPICKAKISRNSYIPYIFTNDQLNIFFKECENIKKHPLSNKHILLPTIYRLLYSSGIRISEAVALKNKNINLDTGVITINDSKFNKDRLIPLAPSTNLYLTKYFSIVHTFSSQEDFFFMKKDKTPIAANTVYKNFRKLLWVSKIPHGGKGKGPRLHDLRHTFAVHSLGKMVKENMDIYCALPILSTYLGHSSIAATEKYIRLTADAYPGILDKVSGISSYIFPEVDFT